MADFEHIPVLLSETIEGLSINAGGIYIDGTVGGAGHSLCIAKCLNGGILFAIDKDESAVQVAKIRLQGYSAKVYKADFTQMAQILNENGILGADGILLDLGVSSHQLDTKERGFSYRYDAPLDMRMSKQGASAYDIVNAAPKQELVNILYSYGEEKYAPLIANKIVKARELAPIKTTLQLAELVTTSLPSAVRRKEKNPAKKTFQAIRIAVNDELNLLKQALNTAFELLNHKGRLCVISFHSLEDRIVKKQFNQWCEGCTCSKILPICVCGNTPKARLITKKAVTASEDELAVNRRAKPAKLRVIEKL